MNEDRVGREGPAGEGPLGADRHVGGGPKNRIRMGLCSGHRLTGFQSP